MSLHRNYLPKLYVSLTWILWSSLTWLVAGGALQQDCNTADNDWGRLQATQEHGGPGCTLCQVIKYHGGQDVYYGKWSDNMEARMSSVASDPVTWGPVCPFSQLIQKHESSKFSFSRYTKTMGVRMSCLPSDMRIWGLKISFMWSEILRVLDIPYVERSKNKRVWDVIHDKWSKSMRIQNIACDLKPISLSVI